jgi:hypothetical protein
MTEIVLQNGILKSTKDVEIFKSFVLIHDMTDGWITYKVPKKLYNDYENDKIEYWDMVLDKSVKVDK